MRAPAIMGLAAVLMLAACDEPTVITHVDKQPHMEMSDLVVMQGPSGIPVEIHGLPWDGADRSALAAAIRPPAGASQGTTFSALPQGGHAGRHGWRLVLHFNPQGGVPRSDHDCKLTSDVKTNAPPDGSYAVNVTFCEGAAWQAHAYLKVLEAEPGDIDAFSAALRQTMLAIFRENSDHDR
ncbi:MAG: hypothetical protein AAF409_05165 [Pseudomonadota bacterium]